MTKIAQKTEERQYFETARGIMETVWENISKPEQEKPDFVVKDGDHQFGLEVTRIFKDQSGFGGSGAKSLEGQRQRQLDKLRRKFGNQHAAKIHLRLLRHPHRSPASTLSKEEIHEVWEELLKSELDKKPIGFGFYRTLPGGNKLQVTVEYHARWYVIDDQVGFVYQEDLDEEYPENWQTLKSKIENAIDEKLCNFAEYVSNAGADIRLLIVADRIYNSGKMRFSRPEEISIDTQRFQAVYFMSYPQELTVFPKTGPSQHFCR